MKIQIKTGFWEREDVNEVKDKVLSLIFIFVLFIMWNLVFAINMQAWFTVGVNCTGLLLYFLIYRSKLKYDRKQREIKEREVSRGRVSLQKEDQEIKENLQEI